MSLKREVKPKKIKEMHVSEIIELMGESIETSELWPSDNKVVFISTWSAISGLIGICGFPIVMFAIGFSLWGVLALSMAACCQSNLYGGETGTDLHGINSFFYKFYNKTFIYYLL